MKVILLAPTPPPAGGIARWTVRMQNTTLKNGWKIEVVDEKLIGNREVFGKNVRKRLVTEAIRSFNIWKELWYKLKDKDVEVVHSSIPASTSGMIREYICSILTKIHKKKFIIHYRCTIPNMVKSKLSHFVFCKLTNISDLVFVLNTPSLEFVESKTKTPAIVIPNFIDTNEVSTENKLFKSENIKTVLYIGGVIESKGCIDIIEVAKEFPNIQFRLIGRPEEKIKKMNRPRNVILCGEKSPVEVEKELEKADIFMFVSYFWGEGFSNALVEAMAKGLPCIVSDWAANRDMIEDEGGVVVNVGDTKSMVEALKLLKNDKKKLQQMSQWNVNKVKDNYIASKVTDLYVDAYERIIN